MLTVVLLLAAAAQAPEDAPALSNAERATLRERAMSTVERPRSRPFYTDKVEGRRHPELFFRYELFDELLMVLCPLNEHRDAAKRGWEAELARRGVDGRSFWVELEQSVGSYQSAHCLRRGVTRGSRLTRVLVKSVHGDAQFPVRVDLQQCRRRFAAFEAAQRMIGKTTLDKILYTVVAPVTNLSYASTEPHHVEEMAYIDRGCK